MFAVLLDKVACDTSIRSLGVSEMVIFVTFITRFMVQGLTRNVTKYFDPTVRGRYFLSEFI